MPKKYVTVNYSPGSNISANTTIEIGRDILPDAMDVRGTNDPIVNAEIRTGTNSVATGNTLPGQTSLTSDGQVAAASGPASGHIGVLNAHHVAMGNALNTYDTLYMTVEVQGGTNIKS